MTALKRILAVILALISLSLGFHFVAGEIYGVYLAQPGLVWDYLNWLIAFGVIVTLVYHYRKKRALDRQQDDDSVSFSYFSSNLLLFAAMFLAFWFFANWFEVLSSNSDASRTVVGFIWITFNASFSVLGGLTAWQLWQDDPDRNEGAGTEITHPGSLLVSPSGLVVEGQSVAQPSFNAPLEASGDANASPGGNGRETGT